MPRDFGVAQHLAYALQLALGSLFLVSCALKLRRPGAFARTVAGYRLLPSSSLIESFAAAAIIGIEAALAIALLTGRQFEVALALATVTLLAFGAGVTINLRRGRRIACGCFGAGGDYISAQTLARIGLLLAAVAALGALIALTSASVVTVAQILDDPGYLVEGGALAAAIGLAVLWSFNYSSVAAVVTGSLRDLPNE